MKITVMSRSMAMQASYEYHAPLTSIISITDVSGIPAYFQSRPWLQHVLRLQFDDVYENQKNCMTTADAQAICDFVLRVQDHTEWLTVHCEYGISRSAGIAAAIMKSLYNNDSPIWDDPFYCPNAYCYHLLLQAFQARGRQYSLCKL